MKLIWGATTAVLLSLTGCNSSSKHADDAAHIYDLVNNKGIKIGQVTIEASAKESVTLHVQASALPEGLHGIHFHKNGSCETPDFKSAGGHINPDGKAHGLKNPDGPDNADMPNALVSENGSLNYTYENTRISMFGSEHLPALLDENGSAIVIHANPDDGITQPIGGAGPRIACAAIR